jgi:SagB-type dehydrogenase family enzyme
VNGVPQTLTWVPWIHGTEEVHPDDPAETFHEASRLYPRVADPLARGMRLLETSGALRVSATRAVNRRAHLPSVALPEVPPPACSLHDAIAARRSCRAWGSARLPFADLAVVLRSAYGVTWRGAPQPFRAVPSGGALYPLDVYVCAMRVDGLEPALYHFDPLRDVLTRLRPAPAAEELGALSPYPDFLVPAAAVLVVTATFYRSRFKYGQRGYRFALLEAGHLAQNALLAAAALGRAALPLGGYYDRHVDALVGADGLEEATVYLIALGDAA